MIGMDSFIKADVFFFITSVAVFLVTLCALAILLYVVRIVRDVRAIVALVRFEAERVADDVGAFRSAVKEHGLAAAAAFSFLRRFMPGFTKKGRTVKVKKL